jgi:hypothetical protein
MRLLTVAPCVVVAILAPLCVSTAQATRPASTHAQPTEVQRRVLLASLSGYSYRTRQDAQEKLITMGDSVEPGLAHAAATAIDPDARLRARTILDEIRTQRRLRELMEPTRVTLHFDNAPARQVLASLYVRAGAEFRVFPPDPWESAGDEPVTVHLDNVPFWDAVAKLEELTGLTLVDAGWGARFVRVRPELARGRVSVHGPYRVVAEDGPMPGSIRALKVFLEPKVKVIWHARQTKLSRHSPEEFKALGLAWRADRWRESRVIGRSADVLEVELPLEGVMRPIAHVKGTIPALLVAREEVIEDLHPTSWGNAAVAGQTFTWSLLSPVPEVHVLRVGPAWQAFAAVDPARPSQPLALAKELPAVRPTLYDARGTPLLRSPDVKVLAGASYEWSFHQRLPQNARAKAGDGGAEGVAVQPPPPPPCGPPARMKLALPTVTREIAIPFEFGRPPAPAPPK